MSAVPILLLAVWVAVIGSWVLGNRRNGRPDNSVASFRAQLSTLERATPGSSLRTAAPRPVGGSALAQGARPRSDAKRRRREVLVGLLGATGFTFLLAVLLQGVAVVLFLASAGALGAYVYALVQMQKRTQEQSAKVRVLTPRSAPSPVLAYRQSASN